MESENIILLTGARQTGKTSMLYLLIRHLLKSGVPPSGIFYFDLENIHDFNLINGLKDFNDFWSVLKDNGWAGQDRVYVFIDEIQHLDRPSSFLKYLYDHYKPRLKFIVTGSSSLEIKKKFTDRLTGRVFRFNVRPLDFQEFLQFRKEDELKKALEWANFRFWLTGEEPEKAIHDINPSHISRVNVLLKEYLICGGYPGVSLKSNPLIMQKDLQEIYSLYIRRDIKDIGEIADIDGYNKLVTLLCLQTGGLIKEQELSVSSGLSRPTIKKYLFLLENTFVLGLLLPFYTNKRKEITKSPKVYFEDVGLRNAVINNFVPPDRRSDGGAILENFVYTQLSRQKGGYEGLRFWRSQSKKEVDFIWQEGTDEIYPIEVKTRFSRRQPVPPGLRSFISEYTPPRAFILHTGGFNVMDFKNTRIYLVPVWAV